VSAIGARLRAARDLGAAEILLKPIDLKELLASVRKAARRDH
jgi:DNA-binding response OmpR family regulator